MIPIDLMVHTYVPFSHPLQALCGGAAGFKVRREEDHPIRGVLRGDGSGHTCVLRAQSRGGSTQGCGGCWQEAELHPRQWQLPQRVTGTGRKGLSLIPRLSNWGGTRISLYQFLKIVSASENPNTNAPRHPDALVSHPKFKMELNDFFMICAKYIAEKKSHHCTKIIMGNVDRLIVSGVLDGSQISYYSGSRNSC